MLNVKKFFSKNIELKLFLFSLFLFLILGILLLYNFDFSRNYNLIFDSDSERVIRDIALFDVSHYRINVHPLFLIIVQPIYHIINLFISDTMLSIVFLSAITSSLTIVFIYKIFSIFSNNTFIKLLLSLCYSFSFTNIIFSSCAETYNFATLFLVILFYYFIKVIKNNKCNWIILVLFGIFTLAFTVTNYMVFLIIMFFLLISKRLSFLKTIGIVILSLGLSLGLNYLQHAIWPKTPTLIKTGLSSEKTYTNYNIGLENINNVYRNDYSNAIIANDVKVKVLNGYGYSGSNYQIDFVKNSILNRVLIAVMYLFGLVLVIRNFKKNSYINLAFISSLLFNTILHTLYGNDSTFLYSMHFMYIIILLIGINLLCEDNNTLKKWFKNNLLVFIIYEIIVNISTFGKIMDIVSNILNNRYLYLNDKIFSIGLIILLSIVVCDIVYLIVNSFHKTFIKKRYRFIIMLGVFLLIFKGIFLGFNFASKYTDNRYVIKDQRDITKYVYSTLKAKYENEMIKLAEYESEYKDFIKKYNPKVIDFINDDFYFFGFANRKKMVFLKDGLFDIEKNDYLYKENIKEYVIIPNIYMVLVETSDGDFIRIYEDKNGVHYEKNNVDKIIEGTNIKLKLYDFDKQQYSNIKKVLYSEILFNIKDSKIYPNILVYDNPWYRDAAMVSMVLEQTNNTDLISDWVYHIKDLYDRQNKGNEEPDNLGELLYIISTQKKKNKTLINRILQEAKKNSLQNGGKYLSGLTDYSSKPIYQNLWYKLGVERLGYKYTFDITGLKDDYYNLTWWIGYYPGYYEIYNHDDSYPYLSMAQYHKHEAGTFYVNKNLYPLSWEKNASEANYNGASILGNDYVNNHISPVHSWSASEMLLFLLDETDDLKKIK